MNTHREIAYRIDPALWMREVLGIAPRPWRKKFLCAPRGASMLALTARQVGKTTQPPLAWRIPPPLWVKSRHVQHPRMSALPPIADMCGANRDVRFVPIADIRSQD